MLAAVALHSWPQAIMAFAGNVIGNVTAVAAGYSRRDIYRGLYGFNGTLVGIAVGVYFRFSVLSAAVLVVGAALSSWIARLFSRRKGLPGLTAPFIISVWAMMSVGRIVFPDMLPVVETPVADTVEPFGAFCRSVGQVMFQCSTLSGMLFLVGISCSSLRGTLNAAIGAALPLLAALIPGIGYGAFNAGLFGYNGVLCAMALGGSVRNYGWVLIAVALSVVLQIAGMAAGLATLTAPFVLSVWIVECLHKTVSRMACKRR